MDNNSFLVIYLKNPVKMARYRVEICLKKKKHPEHKYFVTFVTKVGTINQTELKTHLSEKFEQKSGQSSTNKIQLSIGLIKACYSSERN